VEGRGEKIDLSLPPDISSEGQMAIVKASSPVLAFCPFVF
jgi:hypothetical protein